MLEFRILAKVDYAMRFAFPITLADQRDGAILVSFPDVPEALTEGADEAEALAEAQDCLIAALGGYMSRGWAIPQPSLAEGRPTVRLPERARSKLALYVAMQESGVRSGTLAKRLGRPRTWVDRLLDLDGQSRATYLQEALTAIEESVELTPGRESHQPGV